MIHGGLLEVFHHLLLLHPDMVQKLHPLSLDSKREDKAHHARAFPLLHVENVWNQTISNVFNIVSIQHAETPLFLFTILTSLVMPEKTDSFV